MSGSMNKENSVTFNSMQQIRRYAVAGFWKGMCTQLKKQEVLQMMGMLKTCMQERDKLKQATGVPHCLCKTQAAESSTRRKYQHAE